MFGSEPTAQAFGITISNVEWSTAAVAPLGDTLHKRGPLIVGPKDVAGLMHSPTITKCKRGAALLLVLWLGAGDLYAKQQLQPSGLPKPSPSSAQCADFRWHADWLSWFPRIADGCKDVVKVRGHRWARLQGMFIRHRPDGAFVSQLLDGEDNLLGGITLLPAAGQGVEIDGHRYLFSELVGEQRLNFYVPEGELAVASQPGAPAEQYALIVRTAVAPGQAQAPSAPLAANAAVVDSQDAGLRSEYSATAAAAISRRIAPISASPLSAALLCAFFVGLLAAVWRLRRLLVNNTRGLKANSRVRGVISDQPRAAVGHVRPPG